MPASWWPRAAPSSDGPAGKAVVIARRLPIVAAMTDTVAPPPSPGQFPERVAGDRRRVHRARGVLEFHRGTFRWKCDGLSPEYLVERAIPTTSLTLVGLARHLAENEQWWFRRQAAHLELDDSYCAEEFPDGESN